MITSGNNKKLSWSDLNMRKSIFFTIILLCLVTIISSIYLYSKILDITTDTTIENSRNIIDKSPRIYIGVVSRFSPHLLYEGYQPAMDYLSKETPYQFSLRLSHSYQETIEQLSNGDVAAAFLGTYIYIQDRDANQLECILKPLNSEGRPFFKSVVIAARKSTIHSLDDLKNKRLALPSPHSYSANWLFTQPGLKRTDFSEIQYFDFHNTVIYQILKGNFDGGIVKDRVAREFADKGLRIVARSKDIPASPLVVHKNTSLEIREAITRAFLKIDISQPEYKNLVKDWDPEFRYGFTEARDSDYRDKGSEKR